MKEIKTIEEFKEVTSTGKSIILFTANWCPDCMVIKPFMPSVIEKYTNFNFYTVNRDNLMDLCIELDIFGIPSFVAFKDGLESTVESEQVIDFDFSSEKRGEFTEISSQSSDQMEQEDQGEGN